VRAFSGARAGLLPGCGARGAGERAARGGAAGRARGGAIAVRALILGGTRSGKSAFAEGLALKLGGESVLYVATALARPGDPELLGRIEEHRERRHSEWGLLELAGGGLVPVLKAADGWGAVLLDSLTLWVSARLIGDGAGGTLEEFDRFVELAGDSSVPVVLVSDEVGSGTVPESAEARRFRDLLGLVNQRAAAAAEEVHFCVAGLAHRIK
jgi:adenosylcobinamide kinase / adenosylcobinamide-phosphate guanylyltransferase